MSDPAFPPFCRRLIFWVGLAVASVTSFALAADVAYEPKIAAASTDGELAIKSFRMPPDLKVELFAAEPLLANPVAFCVDEQGGFYIAETFRLHAGVTDTRGHMSWLDDDLACRTIEDRVAMYRRHLGANLETYGVEHDRVQLVEDRDGDGKADHATVFADGFRDLSTGLGAGVLARKGNVWYSCIPDLWLLRDTNGDGKADVRKSLHRGYGVHVGFIGHDLHGLRFGPDGKLYFSIGDRGLNVRTPDRHLVLPDTGAVLRCNPDGSELEVFATGLRNPQELAFDEYGNLFTVDNNSDGGDRARLVHVVEGGDSGWRIGYQFIESPSRGPWNTEKLWRPLPANEAAYLLPPLANLGDGPSGLTYNPGTALNSKYRGRFFLADFRGSANNSGVRSFSLKPKGASFALADSDQFLWGLEATDVDFGPDGALYVSDWVEGWGLTGKGRLYRVFDPGRRGDAALLETKELLSGGVERRSLGELGKFLAHPDMRVRQAAQFALAEKGNNAIEILRRSAEASDHQLARIHAVWGLGQVGRRSPEALASFVTLLRDPDPEIRAQAARVLGDARVQPEPLVALLGDENPRVRFFAALAAGKLGRKDALEPLLKILRGNADQDPYLRHAAVMGLVGITDVPTLLMAAQGAPASVRLGIVLALRRLESAEVARFLDDPEPRIVLEAARAINDEPIDVALPRLAALHSAPEMPPALLRRILNANVRGGTGANTAALVGLARSQGLPESIRVEALDALADWAKPSGRDRVMGLWRPLPERPAGDAVHAVQADLSALLTSTPEAVRRAAARVAGRLGIKQFSPELRRLLADSKRAVDTRVEALNALDRLEDADLVISAKQAMGDQDSRLRTQGLRVLARIRPAEALPALESAVERGPIRERQGALAILGELSAPEVDAVLLRWMDRLGAGSVDPEVRLDLVDAAGKRSSAEVKKKLEAYEAAMPKDDPLAPYRNTLAGGNARRGRRVFQEKTEVSCLRCHKINGQGGEVGPDLTGIGKRQPREYLLQAIVAPNAKIAEGFETLVLATNDGQVHAGVLKSEDADTVKLMTPEAHLISIPKSAIEERKRGASAMPEDLLKSLSKSEIRDLVEFLAGSR
jgi:quinoprotein glucose dehydrogenase